MELLTIRESSLGAFAEALQEAILQGYRHSQDPTRYAWIDNQFNAVLERSDAVVVDSLQDESEPSQTEPVQTEPVQTEPVQTEPTKQSAGRPRRKL